MRRLRRPAFGPLSKRARRRFRHEMLSEGPLGTTIAFGFTGLGPTASKDLRPTRRAHLARLTASGGIDSAHAQDPPAERHRSAVERQRRRARLAGSDRPGQPGLRGERVLARRAAQPPAQARLQGAAAHARARRGARHVARRLGRAGDEGMGDGEGRDALHALVPAADRLDRREARLLLRPGRRRHGDRGVLRQGADPGRARRVLVPDRRHPRDVRGARLHRLGPDLAGVHPREPERRAAVHPDRVHVVDGRGARPQDPAAALDGRALGRGDPRAGAARRRRRRARVHDDRAASRSTS